MEIITHEEQAKLQARHDELVGHRKMLAIRINEARELGDLRENGDYHAAREEQGLEEAEIARLEERLANAQVVVAGASPDDIVFIGSCVRIRDVSTEEEEVVKLVGESSGAALAEPVEVTVSSPMGESLMKARVGETVRVKTPRGVKSFEVLEIV